MEHVKGLAVYGPGASLFTLGPNSTVQQFDLNSPSIMVANIQHPVSLLPPSPPNSIEEPGADKSVHSSTTINTSESESNSSIPIDMIGVSESDEDHMTPFARIANQAGPESSGDDSYEMAHPVSNRKEMLSNNVSSSGSRTPGGYPSSLRSRGMTENTYISAGSSLKSTTVGNRRQDGYDQQDIDQYSMGYTFSNTSVSSMSSASRSRQRPSRLRNEIPRSPDEDNKVHDLFKFTRTRLSDIPYRHPTNSNNSRLTNDDLRRQMLSTIFGWHQEVEDMIRDEMTRHPNGSPTRILLAKWLGDMETDIMAASSQNMTSSDWMLLALSGIGGQASQHKLGRAFVQRLLESGDVHVAVTIMLGMGDHNDAIEIYISHKRYMEALILTCLVSPSVWERQVSIIKKWGEWAVQHGQQQLAIRCFACTDQESTEPWTSPSAAQLTFQGVNPSIPEVLSPPLSPPGVQRGPQRSIAKASALKLVTTFGDTSKSKFYSQNDDGQTPIAGGVTPIAESAISPGGTYEAATAFLRPSNNSRFNTPTTARGNGPSFGRGRLPSIGEMTSDLNRAKLQYEEPLKTADPRRAHSRKASQDEGNLSMGNALPRASTASPMMMRDKQRAIRTQGDERPPSPDQSFMAKMKHAHHSRHNGSRDRIPTGIDLQLPLGQAEMEITSPDASVASSRPQWPSRRRGPGSIASSVTSASSTGRSYRANTRRQDDYIHSLDAVSNDKKPRSRHQSRDRARQESRGRHGSKERSMKSREASEDRSRARSRQWHKPKRSPTSPVPMSPEDLANLGNTRLREPSEPSTVRKVSGYNRTTSRNSSRSRRRSPDGRSRPPPLDIRGRSQGRDGSVQRSPSSPVPLSASNRHYQGSEDEEDYQRAMFEQEIFRAKHSRSANRGLNSPAVTKRDRSKSRLRDTSEARDTVAPLMTHLRATSTEHAGDLRRTKEERQRKKEQAARDLEERRKSLAKRPQAPQITHPSALSPAFRIGVEMSDSKSDENLPPRSATEPPRSMYARNGPHVGLPATPKAMRLIIETDNDSQGKGKLPDVPPIPATFAQRHSPQASPDRSPEEKGQGDAPLLTLLPSSVYQPPPRPNIPRSMSAPIPDDPPHFRRKGSADIQTIDEVVGGRRKSQEEMIPPPPPPPPAPPQMVPPMLRELQHLATPPPPPPPPLQHAQRPQQSALSAGMIEIVMDEDEEESAPVAAPNDHMVPVLPPPAPPSKGHNRGRSNGDSISISGRFSKATERLRSASRGRKERGAKSPPVEAPYESIPNSYFAKAPPPVMYDQDAIRSPIENNTGRMSTGLHKSEMI